VTAFRAAADRLMTQHFLLPDDAKALAAAAGRDGIALVPWAASAPGAGKWP